MNITQIVWVPVFLSFFLIPRPLHGFSGSAHSNAILLDSNWQFIFTGNDSSLSFAQIDPSRACETVALPHIFPQKKTDKAPVSGFGWYYREIVIPSSFLGKDILLDFEGACLRARIFVDGISVAQSNFAYLPINVNLTPYLHGRTHIRCAVRVDNRLLPRQFPDKNARGWWMYGGLIREVFLSARSKLRIDSVEISTFHYDKDTFGLRLKLKPAQVLWDSAVILMSSGDRHVPKHRMTIVGTDSLVRIGGIREWTPESPFRYEFSIVPFLKGNAGDTLLLLRGFCQLAAQKSKLYLNGDPYYLRGMARHDVLGSKGPLLTREDRRRDLADLKSLGVNFLRIAHFPQHRDIYELCDSLGLLIMDEMPAWKTGSRFLGSREGREYGASYMKSLIAAHGNYTCVCIWSLGNQFGSFKSSVADYVGVVSAEVKKSDPFRLVTFCSYYYLWDKAFSFVDVIAINEYFGWELASLGMLPPLLDKINNEWPGKPVLVSEFGAQAKRGLRNTGAKLAGAVTSIFSKDLSEDHQALFIRSHMDTIWNKRGYVNGMVLWAYSDYMSVMNKAHTPDMPRGLNSCGIVTRDREKKLSYEVVKSRYSFFRERFAAEQIIPAARR